MMKKIFTSVFLMSMALWAAAQNPSNQAPGGKADQPDGTKLEAFKKKITDNLEARIGKLEEMEDCIKAASDMKAIKDCRSAQSDAAK